MLSHGTVMADLSVAQTTEGVRKLNGELAQAPG
jgi:hypothetical protein